MTKPGTLPAALFRYFVLITVVLVIPLAAFWVHAVYTAYLDEMQTYREAYYEELRHNTELMVSNAIDYIDHERARGREIVRSDLQHRVNDAWAIADNLYRKFNGTLPPEKLTELIRETLRPIRYNDGRGYYFAYTFDGIAQVHAQPALEGSNVLGLQDEEGVYVIKNIIDAGQQEGGGFVSYLWPKPGSNGESVSKLSYARTFEPLGWVIGTGEYVDEIEKTAKDEALAWISQIRFEPGGYVLAGQYDGLILAAPGIDSSTLDASTAEGNTLTTVLIDAARRGGDYVEYSTPVGAGESSGPELSYVAPYDDWQWFVGARVYLGDIEQILDERRMEMVSRMTWGLFQIGAILLVLLLVAWTLVRHLSARTQIAFDRFATFFGRAASTAIELDPTELPFKEFEELANLANEMIRQRRDAQSSLIESEAQMRLVLESTAEAIVGVTNDLIVTMANPSCLRLLGYQDMQEMLGKCFHDLVHHSDAQGIPVSTTACQVCHAFKEGCGAHGMGTFWKVDCSPIPVEFWSHPVKREESIVGGVITFLDISDRLNAERAQERLEDQLRQAQKLEAVGQLAGGVAHDFNNLLQVILGSTELASVNMDPDHPASIELSQVRKAGERAATLVRQLLTFSRHEMINPVGLDLNTLVTGVTKMLQRVIGEHIKLVLDLENDLRPVFADAGHLEQVLLNLCVNARDAMPGGGTITITTMNARIAPDDPDVPSETSTNGWVAMCVEDTGKGMSPGVLDHIFEPFYTTKDVGKGTGLGLATAYGIVKQHGGFFRVSSEPGQGSCFHVFLPAAGEHRFVPEVSDVREVSPVPVAGGKILLAEDDEMVRGLAVQVLEGAGYEVIVACDGNEVMDRFEEHEDEIDLVLLDIVMPGRSGKVVAELIRKRKPKLPILFCSGYDFDMIQSNIATTDTSGLLMKPYSPRDLLERVCAILSA